MRVGTVTGSEVKKNLDGDVESRVLQVEITDPDDVQSVELFRSPGDDSHPAIGTRVVVLAIGDAAQIAVAASDTPATDDLAEGEREIYSTDGSARLATMRVNADGEIVLNAGVDFAVQFSALQDQLNTIKADFDAHVHDGVIIAVAGGSGAPAVGTPGNSGPPTSSIDTDIGGAKIDKVRLP